MKIKTNLKASLAGDTHGQHNQTMARGLKVKTGVKGGYMQQQRIPSANVFDNEY